MVKCGVTRALIAISLCFAMASTEAVVPGAQNTDAYESFDVMVASGMPAGVVFMDQSESGLLWVNLNADSLIRLKRVKEGWLGQSTPVPVASSPHQPGIYRVVGDWEAAASPDQYTASMNYPNALDQLTSKADGSPRLDIGPTPRLGANTQVVFAGELEWWATRPAEYEYLLTTFQRWISDWQALDLQRYFDHYAPEFTDLSNDLASFKQHKRRVNGAKKWITLEVSQMSAIVSPKQNDLVVVRYYQIYRSSNYQWQGWKEMLWRYQDDGSWKIVFESR